MQLPGIDRLRADAGGSDNFTLLRLILALLVVFSHSFAMAGRPEPTLFAGYTVGAFAVHCFFAISGYLIAGSYLTTKHAGRFVWKRVLRIVPALMLAVPLPLLLYEWQGHYASNPVSGNPNGSLWTISWEVLMYGLTLLLGLTGLLSMPVVGAALIAGTVLFFVNLHAAAPTVTMIAPFFLLFAAGAVIRLSEHQFDLPQCGALACGALILLLLPATGKLYASAAGNMFFAYGPGLSWAEMQRFLWVLALPFAVLFVCRGFPLSLPLRADYSYGIYIWAWPIQETLVCQAMARDRPLGPWTLFIVSTILTAGCAFASWHLIEKNALRLSHLKASPFVVRRNRVAGAIVRN